MDLLLGQIDLAAVGVLLLVVVAAAAALATGLAGRIAMFIEELPHRNAARARLAPPRADPEPRSTPRTSRWEEHRHAR